MAGGTIAKLSVDLIANSAKFTSELERSRKSVQGMASDLKLIKFDAIINLGERALRTATQIYNLGYSLASLGSDLQRNARTLGMTVEEYQQWQYVAKACDVESEQLMLGIRVLTKNMGDLRSGTGEAKDALARIGITAKDSNKNISALLPEIITSLSKIGSTAEQNQLSMEIFGSRSGLAIANMVREGKNIDDIVKKFKELGLAIDEGTVKKLADSEQAFKDFGFTMQKVKAEVLAPAVTVFAELLKAILDIKKALLDNDWESLWGRMSPKDIGAPMKGGIGSMYLGYEESKRGYEEYEKSLGGMPGRKLTEEEISGLSRMAEEERKRILDERNQYEKEYWSLQQEVWQMENRILSTSQEYIVLMHDRPPTEEEAQQILLRQRDTLNEQTKLMDSILITAQGRRREAEEQIVIEEAMLGVLQRAAPMAQEAQKEIARLGEEQKESSTSLISLGENVSSVWATNMSRMVTDSKNAMDALDNIWKGMSDVFISSVMKMITQWLILDSIQKSGSGWGTSGQSGYGGIVSLAGSLIGLLGEGGILNGNFVPIRQFAGGGIADRPTLGMIAEAGENEAVIPMKGGHIPVEMSGGKGDTNIFLIPHDWDKSFAEQVRKNPSAIIEAVIKNAKKRGEIKSMIQGNY